MMPDDSTLDASWMITLKKSIPGADGAETAELTLREPTVGEAQEAGKAGDSIEQTVSLISVMTKMPKSSIKKMAYSDFRRCDLYFANFTNPGPQTGEA